LRGKRTLVIVPDGFLWQLPFQALEPAAGRYLIEDKAVFYAPSFTVLSEMMKSRSAAQQPRVLALGATGLATTRRETLGLRDIYGPKNTSVFLDAEADESHFRKDVSSYGVLHLAAHGVFEDRNPLASYLVLAKGSLDATAMMNLQLRAGMVVLSGCETGRGEVGNGEGLIGMSWALFVAGSPATVASQWKVDAASTSELMLQFHRGVHGSLSKARAMQQASLAVMKMPQYRHPFYWSGFVVMGQGF
jgi:CHAT domain-containing protein